MTVKEPLAFLLIALAILPFWRHRPRAIFSYSSFVLLPDSRPGVFYFWAVRILSSTVILGLALGLAGISLNNIAVEKNLDGSQIVFVRDVSSSMFGNVFDAERGFDRQTVTAELFGKFVEMRRYGDEYGLVDFGGSAITRSKLSSDKNAFLGVLRAPPINLRNTVLVPSLWRAIALFPADSSPNIRAIILGSDGAIDDRPGMNRGDFPLLAKKIKELNINFWWVFIGAESDWRENSGSLHAFIDGLGPLGRKFRADNPRELEKAMDSIRKLQRGLIHSERLIVDYSLSNWFYGTALAAMTALAIFFLLESGLKQRKVSE